MDNPSPLVWAQTHAPAPCSLPRALQTCKRIHVQPRALKLLLSPSHLVGSFIGTSLGAQASKSAFRHVRSRTGPARTCSASSPSRSGPAPRVVCFACCMPEPRKGPGVGHSCLGSTSLLLRHKTGTFQSFLQLKICAWLSSSPAYAPWALAPSLWALQLRNKCWTSHGRPRMGMPQPLQEMHFNARLPSDSRSTSSSPT